MQRAWLRSFAELHSPMLCWMAGVAVAAIGVTLTLWSAVAGGTFALLAIPLILLAGLAAGLVELVHAFRGHEEGTGAVAARVAGTVALGVTGLPLAAALSFATLWTADCVTIIACFPGYQQVVADVQRGAIPPSAGWQEQPTVRFIAETAPTERIVFQLRRTDDHRVLVYDPTGGVMAPYDPSVEDPRHRIGNAMLSHCRTSPVTAYYRCDLWESGDDVG